MRNISHVKRSSGFTYAKPSLPYQPVVARTHRPVLHVVMSYGLFVPTPCMVEWALARSPDCVPVFHRSSRTVEMPTCFAPGYEFLAS